MDLERDLVFSINKFSQEMIPLQFLGHWIDRRTVHLAQIMAKTCYSGARIGVSIGLSLGNACEYPCLPNITVPLSRDPVHADLACSVVRLFWQM